MFIRIKPNLKAVAGHLSKSAFCRCLSLFALFAFTGCGDFFAHKPTEIEARNIIREQSIIKPASDTGIRVPEIYTQPPEIVEGKIGDQIDARLYYFTKHHTASKLAVLINTQFVKEFLNQKNKPYPKIIYSVNANDATNQLIVRCPSVAEAEQVQDFLKHVDIPPIQVKIDCLISEIYADVTMDWATTVEIENLLGEGITLSGIMPGAALRDIARDTFGLEAGYIAQSTATGSPAGHLFSAVVDVLISRGYLKILMNPQLEVLNGETAVIETSEQIPLDEIRDVHPTSGFILYSTRYEKIIDRLEVTPYVFGDGYIGIKTKVLIGSKSTPEGVKQTPIVTTREVTVEENRIRQGESLIIGGIRKTEQRSVIRGIPFLKDIPILGILFSSKDFEERTKEVLFILTPTISTGGVSNEEIRADLSRKHTGVKSQDLAKAIQDPFGAGMYTELVEERAAQAEIDRLKARMKQTEAQLKAKELEQKLRNLTEQSEVDKARADQTQIQKAAADKARQEAETTAKQALEDKAKAEAEKSAADKARQEAEATAKQALEDKAKAETEKSAADKARQEAETAAQKAKEETKAQKAATEKARAEAAKAAAEESAPDSDRNN